MSIQPPTAMPEPGLEYLPVDPARLPSIGLLGCGGISGKHLAAYRRAGYPVAMLCDVERGRAESRRDEFFSGVAVTDDHRELLRREDIEVVDITTHVDVRPALVEEALRAGKHVLSQKPFVRDLEQGERLAALADELGLLLAVNQNGRWAPHFSYLLHAAAAGRLGTVTSADFAVYWPHDRGVADHPVFSQMQELMLYDFGIHWFDVIAQLFQHHHAPARTVYATVGRTAGQLIPVPTWAQVSVEYDDAAATLVLRGASHLAECGSYRVDGTDGILEHRGLSLGGPTVEMETVAGRRTVDLEGDWWANGMHGAMADLLRAVVERRQPTNTARTSLPGLALCFAAMRSARDGHPVDPTTVTVPPVYPA